MIYSQKEIVNSIEKAILNGSAVMSHVGLSEYHEFMDQYMKQMKYIQRLQQECLKVTFGMFMPRAIK